MQVVVGKSQQQEFLLLGVSIPELTHLPTTLPSRRAHPQQPPLQDFRAAGLEMFDLRMGWLSILLMLFQLGMSRSWKDEANNSSLNGSQYTALKDFYEKLDGPHWRWHNASEGNHWNFSDPNVNPCTDDWQGLSCNCGDTMCSIVAINLVEYSLTGSLPQSIENLTALAVLNLAENRGINGTLPKGLFELSSLTYLDLSVNHLVGTLSNAIRKLQSLEYLDLSRNRFYGNLPSSLYDLSMLQSLSLAENLFHGTVSSDIELLGSLSYLNLQYNQLTGIFPATIGKLSNLTALYLVANNFVGKFPDTIGELVQLRTVSVGFNNFTGRIPDSFGQLPHLSYLGLSYNKFTEFPDSIGNLSRLTFLSIEFNEIVGTFPSSFTNLTLLNSFLSNGNHFFGSLPKDLGKTQKLLSWFAVNGNLLSSSFPSTMSELVLLRSIECGFNQFTGTLPEGFRNFTHLVAVSMNYNFFRGEISDFFANNNTRFETLQLSYNQFSGIAPVGVWPVLKSYLLVGGFFTGVFPAIFKGDLTIYYFDVSENYLDGKLPTFLSSFPKLGSFNVSVNMFTGPLVYLAHNETHNHLQQLSASYNFLTGPLPASLGFVPDLTYIILNNNQFTGTLPVEWGRLVKLQICFLQNNLLNGPVYPYLVPSITNLDLSNNQFTGPFPNFDLGTVNIRTFAVSSNCLTGSIPTNICNATQLTFLALDGLGTAKSCRHYLFEGSPYLNGFTNNAYLVNNIPDCLFTMPNLQTLHISGNGLPGSLPSNVNISNSLTDLSLSHNQLTGTIPLIIQEREWTNLDLSYNRFTGTLSRGFHSYNQGQSLSLEINRLSGTVPATLINAHTIKILDGNMFACKVDRSDLPPHDPEYRDYSCGSDVVNATLFSWLGLAATLLFTLFFLFPVQIKHYLSMKPRRSDSTLAMDAKDSASTGPRSSSAIGLKDLRSTAGTSFEVSTNVNGLPEDNSFVSFTTRLLFYRSYFASMSKTPYPTSYLCGLSYYFQTLRRLIGVLTCFILIVLIPVYVGTSWFYSSYYFQYAWYVSAALMSGSTPAIVLCLSLTTLLGLTIYLLRLFQRKNRNLTQAIKLYRQSSMATSSGAKQAIADLTLESASSQFSIDAIDPFQEYDLGPIDRIVSSSRDRSVPENISQSSKDHHPNTDSPDANNYSRIIERCLNFLVFVLVALWDCVIMIVADALYVYILITYPTTVIVTAEICLAGFKLILNNRIIWIALPYLRQLFFLADTEKLHRDSLASNFTNDIRYQYLSHYDYSPFDISFISFMILLNNLMFPIVAIIIISPECFYNALFAAASVTSDYNYEICDRATIVANTCYGTAILTEQSSYEPPFIPGFECSSAIITNYSPVFVIMFTVEGLIAPMFKILVQWYYYRMKEQKVVVSDDPVNNDDDDDQEANLEISRSRRTDVSRKSVFDGRTHRKDLQKSWLLKLVYNILPESSKELIPHAPDIDTSNRTHFVLFNKNRLAVRINSHLIVLMTFGAIFPPLALIICVTIVTITVYEEIIIGRLLFESERLGYTWYKKQLERDCHGIVRGLKYTLFMLVPTSCALYAYFVFDVWGDKSGYHSSLVVSLPTILIPHLTLFAFSLFDQRKLFHKYFERSWERLRTAVAVTVLSSIFFKSSTNSNRTVARGTDQENIHSNSNNNSSNTASCEPFAMERIESVENPLGMVGIVLNTLKSLE